MARVAPKKYSKMGYFEKQAFTDKMGEKYGVQKSQFEGNGYTNGGRMNNFNDEAYQKAVVKAMANDYDTRRSIEAAQLAGNNKAIDLGKGINNISEAVNAERFMAKTHKNRLDATGKYTSANDEGNVTKFWVDKDRRKLENSMASNSATDEGTVKPYEAPEPGLSYNEAKERGVLSEQAQEADARDESYTKYGTSGKQSDDRYTQDRAFEYLKDYKLDLTSAYGA